MDIWSSGVRNEWVVLDHKRGDVTGDGVIDQVWLIGQRSSQSPFEENITLVIQDGASGRRVSVFLEPGGYGSRLFLGDFTKDRVEDIKVSIDSGGSGEVAYYYIFSFRNNQLSELFNYNTFNKEYPYEVNFQDYYRLEVLDPKLNQKFMIDISGRGVDYLSEIYLPDGKLKTPLKGGVNPLGALWPIVRNEKEGGFDLFSQQRITGRYNADSFGYMQMFLAWEDNQFTPKFAEAAILGSEIEEKYGG